MIRAVFAAGVILGAASAAQAQSASPWAFSARLGGDIPVSGDVHGSVDAPVANLSALDPALSGPGVLRIRGRNWNDLYNTGTTGAVEVRWRRTEKTELFGSLGYTQASGKRGQVGVVQVTNAGVARPIFGTFSDYESFALEVGYRQYFAMANPALKPYVAVRGGLAYTSAISATFDVPGTAVRLANVPFYDDTWGVTFGADAGLLYAISPGAELGAEVGLRYTNTLKDTDGVLRGLGLASINDEGDRISMPVSLRLNASF